MAAIRPTILFVTAFALNVTPHEIAHAVAGYLLGFNSTIFQMWVNPDAVDATRGQLAIIAVAGLLFSLAVGTVCLALYARRFKERASGLAFLMIGIVGIYSFLGPLVGTALGGDFHTASGFLNISRSVGYAGSAFGLVLLPAFMWRMGRELVRWAPPEFGRVGAVVCTTLAPWLLGTLLVLLVYWPLPQFLIGSSLGGSVFWLFAVLGAAMGFARKQPSRTLSYFTGADVALAVVALLMVRLLVHGIRLAH
jgi:hypothetical protein